MSECIFCQIIARKIPSAIVYEDDDFISFRDIKPQAPVHLLIVPKIHIQSLQELNPEQERLAGRLILLATKLAKKEDIVSTGYRLMINCGADAGQIIPHLHLHLLGGARLSDEFG